MQHVRGRKGQAGRAGREMEHDKVSTAFLVSVPAHSFTVASCMAALCCWHTGLNLRHIWICFPLAYSAGSFLSAFYFYPKSS